MRNKLRGPATATMVRLLQNARYEVLPTASRRMPGGRLLESLAGVEW